VAPVTGAFVVGGAVVAVPCAAVLVADSPSPSSPHAVANNPMTASVTSNFRLSFTEFPL
jgi:hypothetical protein